MPSSNHDIPTLTIRQMEICGECGHDYAAGNEDDWQMIVPELFMIALHCSQCGHDITGIFTNTEVLQYEDVLDGHMKKIKEQADDLAFEAFLKSL